jgi:TonB family protein
MKRISRYSNAFLLILLILVAIVVYRHLPPQLLRLSRHQRPEGQILALKMVEESKQKLAKSPDDALEHYRLGGLYEKLPQWENALAEYAQAIRIKPDFPSAHYDLGWVYSRLWKSEEALKAHLDAEKYSKSYSFQLKVQEEKVNYAIGWDLYRLRRYDEAIARYAKAVQLVPTYQEATYEIGRVLMAKGDQEGVKLIIGKLDPYFRSLLQNEMDIVDWADKGESNKPNLPVIKMTQETQPTITYKEKARYISMAVDNNIQGTVVLNVVFGANKKIESVRIVRDLPYGLTNQALIAMQKIKFNPAMMNGKPVSVRGNLEFSFNLY